MQAAMGGVFLKDVVTNSLLAPMLNPDVLPYGSLLDIFATGHFFFLLVHGTKRIGSG